MTENGKLKLLTKMDHFYKDLVPVLRRFPKTQRYTLAERIEKETLSCARLIYFAAYDRSVRLQSLKTLRVNLHLLTFLLRCSHKQSFISDALYERFVRETAEMGQICSQWIKTETKLKEAAHEKAQTLQYV